MAILTYNHLWKYQDPYTAPRAPGHFSTKENVANRKTCTQIVYLQPADHSHSNGLFNVMAFHNSQPGDGGAGGAGIPGRPQDPGSLDIW